MKATPRPKDEWWTNYLETGKKAAVIIGAATFIGAYGCCVVTYGFLLGMGLGWFPSAILAVMTAAATLFLWGPMLIVGILAALTFGSNMFGNYFHPN